MPPVGPPSLSLLPLVNTPSLPGSGMVYDVKSGKWEEMSAREREAAMGHRWDATAHPRVTEKQRRAVMGRAMDLNVINWLIETIRMQLKTKEIQREIEIRAEVQEQGAEGVARAIAVKEKEDERAPEEDWPIGEGMGAEEAEELQKLLKQHRLRFAYTLQEPGDLDICIEKCAELLEAGLIQRSDSDYAAAIVVAARKDLIGEVSARRMCGDYRGLNKVTVADRYPMQSAEEIFDKLQRAIVFSTLDLRQGFNQIPIKAEECKKMAFHGPGGLYEWRCMPFGIKNASALFQRVMDAVLRNIPAAACYIDDVIVFSPSPEQHVKDVQAALEAIKEGGLTCHPKKCEFGCSSVNYLGFEVQGGRMSIQQAKVEVLNRVPAPKDRTTLRAVLGFLNYYRKFVPNFSQTAEALNRLLWEDQAWQWGEAKQGALEALLNAVKTASLLTLPSKEDPFVLYTGWSSAGMGAILCQEREGQEMVVAFASRSCNPAEANYCSYEGEGLAAVWGVTQFCVYLQGKPSTLVTDHQPLTWLMTNQTLTGRNVR
ncbi:unnamed protein product [Closterium sp. NIES-53]